MPWRGCERDAALGHEYRTHHQKHHRQGDRAFISRAIGAKGKRCAGYACSL